MNQLIKDLISSGYLKTPEIIEAFLKIDRADFVPPELKTQAYLNTPLPIGFGQTISQPLTVAFMLELLQPKAGDKVLDIGSGSGWQTALLAYIVEKGGGRVFAMEIIPELISFGRKNVFKYSFIKRKTVKFYCLNAIKGLSEEAPFDKIISAAASKEIPPAWKEQLNIGGRIVAPVKDAIHLLIKTEDKEFEKKIYPGFAFVPFVEG